MCYNSNTNDMFQKYVKSIRLKPLGWLPGTNDPFQKYVKSIRLKPKN